MMIKGNQNFIIQYLYLNNHKNEQSALPIDFIHRLSKLHKDDFNSALDLLLRETPKRVNQIDKSLYLTPAGQLWYEENLEPQLSKKTTPKRHTWEFYKDEFAKYVFKRYMDIIVVGIGIASLIIFGLFQTCNSNTKEKVVPTQLKTKETAPINIHEMKDKVFLKKLNKQ